MGVYADLHLGDSVRVFTDVRTGQSTDRDLPGGRRVADMDTLDVQEFFVDFELDLGDSTLRLRPGRQMLSFGAQRLISPLPWANVWRSWEGLTALWRGGDWEITGIATRFVLVDKTDFNEGEDDISLLGVYARRAAKGGREGVELYALATERPDVNANGTLGDEERLTVGGRRWSPFAERFDYEVEAAWQTGEVGAGDVGAWFVSSQIGWRPEGIVPGDPRLFIGLDGASGDDEVGGDVGTFHPLFPLGHAYFGYIDVVGRSNIAAAAFGAKWQLTDRTAFAVSLHHFRLMELADALYDAGNNRTRAGADSRTVGSEVDLLLESQLERYLFGYAGYSHLFPGAAIGDTGPDAGIDFLYLGLRYTF